VVAVLGGSEVAVMVDDDQVRHVDVATMRVGTKSTDNARDNPWCCTDNARDIPGSVGVTNVDKEDAPAVACVESCLLQWVGVGGCWLRNMLPMNSTHPPVTPRFSPQNLSLNLL
jgi:hypothetical protein